MQGLVSRGRESAFQLVERLVIPVQGTDREFVAQQWAVEMASVLGVPLRAVHVAAPIGPRRRDLFEYLTLESAKWSVELETRIVRGTDVVEELVQELDSRDLVIVGTRRMSSHFHLGSVAEGLVRRAPCPVQVVRLE